MRRGCVPTAYVTYSPGECVLSHASETERFKLFGRPILSADLNVCVCVWSPHSERRYAWHDHVRFHLPLSRWPQDHRRLHGNDYRGKKYLRQVRRPRATQLSGASAERKHRPFFGATRSCNRNVLKRDDHLSRQARDGHKQNVTEQRYRKNVTKHSNVSRRVSRLRSGSSMCIYGATCCGTFRPR